MVLITLTLLRDSLSFFLLQDPKTRDRDQMQYKLGQALGKQLIPLEFDGDIFKPFGKCKHHEYNT